MPRLWKQQPDGSFVAMGLDGGTSLPIAKDLHVLPSSGQQLQQRWAILQSGRPTTLRVNGEPLPLGLRVLRDRDAIQTAGEDGPGLYYFSTDSSAVVAPFAGAKPIPCARCHELIRPGEAVVQCPACGAVHHQLSGNPDFSCWTYDSCANCRTQPTTLDDRELWTPADLEASP